MDKSHPDILNQSHNTYVSENLIALSCRRLFQNQKSKFLLRINFLPQEKPDSINTVIELQSNRSKIPYQHNMELLIQKKL